MVGDHPIILDFSTHLIAGSSTEWNALNLKLFSWFSQESNLFTVYCNITSTYFLPASSRCPARPGRRWVCGWRMTLTWRRWWTDGRWCRGPPPRGPATTPATAGWTHHSWKQNTSLLLWRFYEPCGSTLGIIKFIPEHNISSEFLPQTENSSEQDRSRNGAVETTRIVT